MIQTGTAWYDVVNTPEWNLNAGIGDRSVRTPDIPFNPPFSQPPHVVLALAGVDSERTANLRVALEPHDIEPGEFSIKIKTWHDTALYGVGVAWIAYD